MNGLYFVTVDVLENFNIIKGEWIRDNPNGRLDYRIEAKMGLGESQLNIGALKVRFAILFETNRNRLSFSFI